MSDRVFIGTRKGLFEIERRSGAWEVAAAHFLGDPVSAVLATGDTVYAALDLGHFGAKLWRRGRTGNWRELPVPAFPLMCTRIWSRHSCWKARCSMRKVNVLPATSSSAPRAVVTRPPRPRVAPCSCFFSSPRPA